MRAFPPKRIVRPVLWLALLALVATGAAAQEEAESPDATPVGGMLTVSIEVWSAQPTGMEYSPATVLDSGGSPNTELLTITHGTDADGRYALGYRIPGGHGTVSFQWQGLGNSQTMTRRDAGNFVYGQITSHPLYAGFNNDGLTDSFETNTRTSTREWVLQFSRTAFRTPRVHGTWGIGWRRMTHKRDMNTIYRALLTVPDLPPLFPPIQDCGAQEDCPSLTPSPDTAQIYSFYKGRGLNAAFDVAFNLWKDRLILEGGIDVAALRGKLETTYSSLTSAYACDGDVTVDGFTICEAGDIVNPPYDIFDLPIQFDFTGDGSVSFGSLVSERSFAVGLLAQSRSRSSTVIETDIAARWKALRWMDVYLGFRQSRYSDVGMDLRPKAVTDSPSQVSEVGIFNVVNVQDLTEVDRSVEYEGFYAGIEFRWD